MSTWTAAFMALLMAAVSASAQERAAEKTAQMGVAKSKAVRFGKLWDGKGKVWTNAIVIVEGQRVKEVTTDAKKIPAGAEVLDLNKYYGIQG